jgi:hypothetical protein
MGNGVWEITDSTGRTVKILVDPAPRAALVRLPEWQPGTSRILYMPYGTEVVSVLRGYLNSESLLPRNGNAIGDTWIVGNTPWNLANCSGYKHADMGRSVTSLS